MRAMVFDGVITICIVAAARVAMLGILRLWSSSHIMLL